jgi:hypothetical protein
MSKQTQIEYDSATEVVTEMVNEVAEQEPKNELSTEELEGRHGFVADSTGFPTSISRKVICVRTRFFCREFVQKQRRFLREAQNR